MEKFSHHRSKLPSHNQPQTQRGDKQVHKQRKLPNLSTDSGSCGSGAADEDSFSFKFGWGSSKKLFGTPIKKLLAEEMSRETESKRRAPSVIARLMGLDGLPLQHPANKQHKGLSENRLQRTTQTRNREFLYDGRSSRRSSKDQQEFKDVFEVSEIPKVESNRYSSKASADFQITDAEISFIEQKFMDAKRLATYQDLQSSKDFHDTLEVLDSNKDLLLKYFKRPDSLFKKHLNDLQAAPLQSHFGHLEAVETSDFEKYEYGDLNWKLDRVTTQLNYSRYHQKHHDCRVDRRHAMYSSPKSSNLQFKGKDKHEAVPTRIVVLKPNLGKVQNSTKIVSSPCSSQTFESEHGMHTKYSDVRFRDKVYQKKNLPDTARPSRQNSLESREIAKEITRQMKKSLNNGSMIISSSKFRGYAEDDSSYTLSENESLEESEVTAAALRDSFGQNNRSRRSSHSSESSVSREAKKRLSERWNMTHKSQEAQVISRSSTLAEMLAVPDKVIKPSSFDGLQGGEGFHDEFASNGEPARSVEPLGISSRDGWKDGYIGSLSRSKSLPASSTTFGNPRTILRHEALCDDRFMMPKEALRRERKRAAKSLDQRHAVNTRSTKSGHKKSWSSYSLKIAGDESSPELNTIQNKAKVSLEEYSPNQDVLVTQSLAETVGDTSAVTEDLLGVANDSEVGTTDPSDKVLPELSSCMLITGDTSAADEDNSMQQKPSAGPSSRLESSCCKDADQPSPVSVLEPSFTDDLSSCSDCFESLSNDLQGLRMQLKLLKLESEEDVEGTMLISSDEDGGEPSTGILENKGLCRIEDNWESSYIIDVLSESGIKGAQLDMTLEAWHSPERPVSLSVFEELENRYTEWTTCPRSERRLLFDRINSGIVMIHGQFANALPWVSPATTNSGSKLIKNGLQGELCRMLVSHGKVNDDALGKVLVREPQWLDLRDGIDAIGGEVERLLLDDLVAEIVSA